MDTGTAVSELFDQFVMLNIGVSSKIFNTYRLFKCVKYTQNVSIWLLNIGWL